MSKVEKAFKDLFSSEVTVNCYVFRPLMEDRVLPYVNGCNIVTIEGDMLKIGDFQLFKNSDNPGNLC